MADLSNLLGDVYGDPADEGAAAPDVPPWANDERLDEAFADWAPEPLEPVVAATPTSPPAATNATPAASSTPSTSPAATAATASAPLDDDLAAALSAALADAPRPPTLPVERFRHVAADEPTEPPLVDLATLEPMSPAASPSAPAEPLFLEPPTEVVEPKEKRRSFSRRPKAPKSSTAEAPMPIGPVVDPVAEPVAASTGGRAWQRSDDDILPARIGSSSRKGAAKSINFRLR